MVGIPYFAQLEKELIYKSQNWFNSIGQGKSCNDEYSSKTTLCPAPLGAMPHFGPAVKSRVLRRWH